MLVVLPFEGKPVRKAIEIRNKVQAELPLDLIVRTPEQLAERVAQNDGFFAKSLKKATHCMKQITSEWVIKAEGDFATSQRELGATDRPN